MQRLLTVFLAMSVMATSHAHVLAAPAALSLQERYTPSTAPGSGPESIPRHDGEQGAALSSHRAETLPGVNHKPVPTTVPSGANANANETAAAVTGGANRLVVGHRCRQLTLLGDGKRGQSTLQAACLDDATEGAWWLTSLNLNQCLGNEGGKLVFQERGNYDATCRPCGIETMLEDGQVLLRCACLRKGDGVSTFAEVSLSHRYGELGIMAVDGRLVCGSHQGTKSPQFGAPPNEDGGER